MKKMKIESKIKDSTVEWYHKNLILETGDIPEYWDSLDKLEEAEAAMQEISDELQNQANGWDEARLILQAAIHKWREDEVT